MKITLLYLSLSRSNLISCERVALGRTSANENRNFTYNLSRSNFISCERVVLGQVQMKIAILPQLLAIECHFVRNSCARTSANENRYFTSVFGDGASFRAKGLHRTLCKLQFYRSFSRSNLVSCERVATGRFANRNFTSVFWRSNIVSCERVAFPAGSLALPRAFKREIEKKERARGQESKRARENVKM